MNDDEDDYWQISNLFIEDSKACLRILDDLPAGDPEKVIWRRMLARATFALIDSVTDHLMVAGFAATATREGKSSPEELEKYFDFSKEGEARPTFRRSTMVEAMEYSFRAFAEGLGSDFVLPTSGPEWQMIDKLEDLRERLEYPKTCADLALTEADDELIMKSIKWLGWCWDKLVGGSPWDAVASFQGGHPNDPSTS